MGLSPKPIARRVSIALAASPWASASRIAKTCQAIVDYHHIDRRIIAPKMALSGRCRTQIDEIDAGRGRSPPPRRLLSAASYEFSPANFSLSAIRARSGGCRRMDRQNRRPTPNHFRYFASPARAA